MLSQPDDLPPGVVRLATPLDQVAHRWGLLAPPFNRRGPETTADGGFVTARSRSGAVMTPAKFARRTGLRPELIRRAIRAGLLLLWHCGGRPFIRVAADAPAPRTTDAPHNSGSSRVLAPAETETGPDGATRRALSCMHGSEPGWQPTRNRVHGLIERR